MIKRHAVSCYLPRRTLDDLKRQARIEGVSLSAFTRQLLTLGLAERPSETIGDLAYRMLFATLALEALLSTHADKGLYEQVTKAWRAARDDGEGA